MILLLHLLQLLHLLLLDLLLLLQMLLLLLLLLLQLNLMLLMQLLLVLLLVMVMHLLLLHLVEKLLLSLGLLTVGQVRHRLVTRKNRVIPGRELLLAGSERCLEGLQHGALQRMRRHMRLALQLHAFVAVLVGLQLSLVHCGGGVLLPLQPPPLSWSLGGISVNLHGCRQLILPSHRQSYAFMAPFVERHLTSDVHSAHVGAKVLAPARSLLGPAGGLYGVLVHPFYWSSLLIVWKTLGPFLWVINTRAAGRVTVACL